MNFLPKIRPRPIKRAKAIRQAPAFRRWVKKLQCSVKGCQNVDIDPAHVRYGLPPDALKGGGSLKPHDCWVIPLCRFHHDEQHNTGEQTFAAKYKIHGPSLAHQLWNEWQRTTETGLKWRREHDG